MKETEVRILNRREDMPPVASLVSRFGAENGLPADIFHDLNVVVDEALNNIISYGYGTDAPSEIILRLQWRRDEVTVMIEDRGRPFDPLQVPAPDLSAPLRSREIGGLGIHFIRSLMDDVSYTHSNGVNRLLMTKKIAT